MLGLNWERFAACFTWIYMRSGRTVPVPSIRFVVAFAVSFCTYKCKDSNSGCPAVPRYGVRISRRQQRSSPTCRPDPRKRTRAGLLDNPVSWRRARLARATWRLCGDDDTNDDDTNDDGGAQGTCLLGRPCCLQNEYTKDAIKKNMEQEWRGGVGCDCCQAQHRGGGDPNDARAAARRTIDAPPAPSSPPNVDAALVS